MPLGHELPSRKGGNLTVSPQIFNSLRGRELLRVRPHCHRNITTLLFFFYLGMTGGGGGETGLFEGEDIALRSRGEVYGGRSGI